MNGYKGGSMTAFRDNPFREALEMVATLRDRGIEASLAELRCVEDMNRALAALLEMGVDIDSLSDASGIPTDQIRQRIERVPTPLAG